MAQDEHLQFRKAPHQVDDVQCRRGLKFLLHSDRAHIKAQHDRLRLRVSLEARENVQRGVEVRASKSGTEVLGKITAPRERLSCSNDHSCG
jgi:hypothetical protein